MNLRISVLFLLTVLLGNAAGQTAPCLSTDDSVKMLTAPLQTSLGEFFYKHAEYSRADSLFLHAIALDMCYGRAHYFRWRIESLLGHEISASKELELAFEYSPDDINIKQTRQAVHLAEQLTAQANAPQLVPTRNTLSFYAKQLNCDSIIIRSSMEVDSRSLFLACYIIHKMVANMPSVRKSLAAQGGELHIIGEHEKPTDLPENRRFYGEDAYRDAHGDLTNLDIRTRGLGGLQCSCGEENLLHLPSDRYYEGENICVHEFAHSIMNYGLTSVSV